MLSGIGTRRKASRLNLAAIPNCEFWVDAARIGTITYASGSNVQEIRDLSGKNRHLTKTGSGNDTIYPVYNAAEKGIQFLSTAFDQMVAGNVGDWNFMHNGTGCTIMMMLKVNSDFAANGILLSTASDVAAGVGTNLSYYNTNQNLNVTTRNGTSQTFVSNGATSSLQKDITQIFSVHIENRASVVPDLVTRNKGITDIITNPASTFSNANSTDKLFVSKLASGVMKGKFILKKVAIFSRRLRPDEEQRILRAWAKDDNITLTLPAPKNLAVIAGQSNAKGRGVISESSYVGGAATISNAYIWNNSSFAWANLQAGVNNDAYDTTKLGVEMSLAKNFTTSKAQPLYIMKYAVDGTSVVQWLPATGSFNTLRDMIQRAVWSIEDSGSPVRPVAFIWYQGESDAMNATDAGNYMARLQQFIDGVNTIYGVAQIPFFIVQIQQSPYQVGTVTVQDAGFVTSVTSPYSAYTSFVETGDIAVNLDTHHITAASFEALGQRIVSRIRD
ncbi:MAG TPA: sialate O-acetylesterase [Alphaproteobacteria bacterium]